MVLRRPQAADAIEQHGDAGSGRSGRSDERHDAGLATGGYPRGGLHPFPCRALFVPLSCCDGGRRDQGVERPKDGDAGRAHPWFIGGHSGYFLQQNMGKRGLCVNLKDPRGLALMHKLSDSADVRRKPPARSA